VARLEAQIETNFDQIKSLQGIIANDTTPAGREVASWRSERDALRAALAALEDKP
jgi:hypothetical protein